jgi:hypothetical protein
MDLYLCAALLQIIVNLAVLLLILCLIKLCRGREHDRKGHKPPTGRKPQTSGHDPL